MGLLTQAIAGGIGAAADTTATIMTDNNRARLLSEREQAEAVRRENLEKLRADRDDTRATLTYQRGEASKLASEERAYGRTDSGLVNSEGLPQTRADADSVRKQEETAMEQGPVKPSLLAAGKYSEENTISKEFMTPEGGLISVAEAKQRQKEGLPLKLRSDLEHDRTLKEKEAEYKRGRKDKKEDRDADTAAEIKKEQAKAKTEVPPTKEGPTMRYVLAKKGKRADGSVGPVTLTFNMSKPDHRELFSQWLSSGQGEEVYGTETKQEDAETGAVTKVKTAPSRSLVGSAKTDTTPNPLESTTKTAPAINQKDPRVIKAKSLGYTDAQIQAYLAGKR